MGEGRTKEEGRGDEWRGGHIVERRDQGSEGGREGSWKGGSLSEREAGRNEERMVGGRKRGM